MCTTKVEIQKIVKEELASVRQELKEDMLSIAQAVAKDTLKHERPAPETLAELKKIDNWIQRHEEVSNSFKQALFGDPQTGELGLVRMTRDMHEKFLSFSGVKGLFNWILLTGGVIGLLYALFKKV